MAKIDIELVKMVLQRNELDIRLVSQILEDINLEVKNQAEEDEKLPSMKKQYTVLISDPDNQLEGKDLTAWVCQIPEEDSPALTQERIIRSAYEFNASPKGRRMPVKTIGEACEVVSSRFFKENKIWVKTKEPVLVLTTDNIIPQDNFRKSLD